MINPNDGAAEQSVRAAALIPGAREANTVAHRQPGSIGGRANGADLPFVDDWTSMDAVTINEHRHEGGGAERDR